MLKGKDEWLLRDISMLTFVKYSWASIWSSVRRSDGFFWRIAEISFCADGMREGGRLYLTALIHL